MNSNEFYKELLTFNDTESLLEEYLNQWIGK